MKVGALRSGGVDYGYRWWLGVCGIGKQPWIAGFGNGGQRLFVTPGLDFVVAIMASNYNSPTTGIYGSR